MAQATQQYSAAQILEAGRRAQAEGRLDHAIQFYRHLTEHLAFTPEAAIAEQAMQRLGGGAGGQPAPMPAAVQPGINGQFNGQYNGQAAAFVNPAPAGMPAGQPTVTRPPAVRPAPVNPPDQDNAAQRKLMVPRVRRRYRTGRFIARAVTFIGFVMMGSGTGVFVVALLTFANLTVASFPMNLASQSPLLSAIVGGTLVVIGAMMVLAGQLGRAIFDQASASRDIAALTRARVMFDARAGDTDQPARNVA